MSPPSKPRRKDSSPTPGGTERVLLFADTLHHQAEAAEAAHLWESWLTVRMGAERLALPIRQVLEVVRAGAITRVPHAPYPVCGVTSLRGAVIAVVDLRLRLGQPAIPLTESSRVVVVASKGRRIGLLVDSAEQVLSVDMLAIEPVPDDVLTDRSYYLRGVWRREGELIVLLAIDEVLQVRTVDDSALDPNPSSEARS